MGAAAACCTALGCAAAEAPVLLALLVHERRHTGGRVRCWEAG